MDALFDIEKLSISNRNINPEIIKRALRFQETLDKVGASRKPSYQLDRPLGQTAPIVETRKIVRIF